MSESQSRRESVSDFSIERILAKDGGATSSPSSSTCKIKDTKFVRSPTKCIQNKLDWLRSFRESESTDDSVSDEPIRQNDTDANSRLCNSEELTWLRCTRYHPPKLPRKLCSGKNIKRKPGSHPRIPFTKTQLEILEDKYKSNAYLTRKDVQHLSDILQLPQTRIKIWFQNRRARERRETQVLQTNEATI